jgi:hypothetical protein
VTPGPADHPIVRLPVVGGRSDAGSQPARHETVLSEEPVAAREALAVALAAAPPDRRAALAAVVADHPAFLEAWARLSELVLADGDTVMAYACARVAYHRGLDRLRREGWGGTGMVRWARPTNRGFLRGLHALMASAAAIGEEEESGRCRNFLLELDPEDTLGVAGYPAVPGAGWTPPVLP